MATWRYKDGFFIGLASGILAFVFIIAKIEFPFRQQTIGLSIILAGILLLITLIFLFITPFKRGSIISPASDGFIYGFTAFFDSVSIGHELISGTFFNNLI